MSRSTCRSVMTSVTVPAEMGGDRRGPGTTTRMSGSRFWPARLELVRHGESAGNVANDQANAQGLNRLDLATRDMDVPLSPLGEEQARSLGRWLADVPPDQRPTIVLSSPYRRGPNHAPPALGA